MRAISQKTSELGELIVAAFDKAALYSTSPGEVSRLATRAVLRTLRRTRRLAHRSTRHLVK